MKILIQLRGETLNKLVDSLKLCSECLWGCIGVEKVLAVIAERGALVYSECIECAGQGRQISLYWTPKDPDKGD